MSSRYCSTHLIRVSFWIKLFLSSLLFFLCPLRISQVFYFSIKLHIITRRPSSVFTLFKGWYWFILFCCRRRRTASFIWISLAQCQENKKPVWFHPWLAIINVSACCRNDHLLTLPLSSPLSSSLYPKETLSMLRTPMWRDVVWYNLDLLLVPEDDGDSCWVLNGYKESALYLDSAAHVHFIFYLYKFLILTQAKAAPRITKTKRPSTGSVLNGCQRMVSHSSNIIFNLLNQCRATHNWCTRKKKGRATEDELLGRQWNKYHTKNLWPPTPPPATHTHAHSFCLLYSVTKVR